MNLLLIRGIQELKNRKHGCWSPCTDTVPCILGILVLCALHTCTGRINGNNIADFSGFYKKNQAIIGVGVCSFYGLHKNQPVFLCECIKFRTFFFVQGNRGFTKNMLSLFQRVLYFFIMTLRVGEDIDAVAIF